MFAYVKYEDKYKVILLISLVKTFSPKSEDDFDKTKKVQAFWRSEDGKIQGYYPAFVYALAGDLNTMRLKIKTMREPFPRLIDADELEEVPLRRREIKIGQNSYMPLEKWQHIMKNTTDGRFCLELARHFWPTAEAAKRCLTGQACRSYSTGQVKLQATPEKVDMMRA
ncbi:hypothetical protein HPB52_015410 [Rhipicephalus sanguineus]|uniref:Uncharacterized protein n=1 Tax=Rhipicephalus sanguineus TaxID=34632 RepID=A0A9D4PBZ2_RHISA|nr:hypothetical protein HPB52_015410 [Rhipicephalus sanguineus]